MGKPDSFSILTEYFDFEIFLAMSAKLSKFLTFFGSSKKHQTHRT